MTPSTPQAPLSYILVHGAWTGSWIWQPVRQPLRDRGHEVLCVELPGHGPSSSVAAADIRFADYLASIEQAIDSARHPLVLVGHSFAGMLISQAGEDHAERIAGLIYLCAFMLPSGCSFLQASAGVRGSVALDHLQFAADGHSVSIAAEHQHRAVAQDVPAAGFAQVQPLLCAEPTAPLAHELRLSSRWAELPRAYLECTADQALPLTVQRAMQEQLPPHYRASLDSGHSPQFSATEALVQGLQLAASALIRS
ncbi:alpha/beta fold hydrolase [Pseudomonas sp. MBLB4123]|uniref:alpha/beta fold hydrolase n=1 Tax=Pseudomonas sp. MBLB4123 TaxID=3451557 RepID=UPI003F74C61C